MLKEGSLSLEARKGWDISYTSGRASERCIYEDREALEGVKARGTKL